MKEEATNNQFIKATRFPLMVLVLFQHSVGGDLSTMQWSLDGTNVYHFITELISHHLCSIAVPCFFFFSGYLFYNHLPGNTFNVAWVKRKWERRVRTLVIPYVLWNLLNVTAVVLITILFQKLGISVTSNQMPTVEKGPLFWFVKGPINFPLWYLRDLIVLSILAPFLYYPIQKGPNLFLAFLFLLYFASTQMDFYPSLTFFGVGCWFAITQKNIWTFCQQKKYHAYLLAFVFSTMATAFWGRQHIQAYLWLVFAPFGMISFINIYDSLITKTRIAKYSLKLSETVFFIYAAHEIYILGWTKGFLLRLAGEGLVGHWICYFAAPLLTLLLCLALFYLLKKLTPKLLSFFCGGRISSIPATT